MIQINAKCKIRRRLSTLGVIGRETSLGEIHSVSYDYCLVTTTHISFEARLSRPKCAGWVWELVFREPING